MQNLIRAFVTTTILVQEATGEQIDQRGAKKALAAVWSELPRFHPRVLAVAEELLDDSTRASGVPLATEPQWLKAIIDEVGTPTPDAASMNEAESWSALCRSTSWLGFCLHQAASYAADSDYSTRGFRCLIGILNEFEPEEKALFFAAVNAANMHLEAAGASGPAGQQLSAAYQQLLDAVQCV